MNNPAEQAKRNAQMTRGQMQQFGTLSEKQKQDLADRERVQRDNARAMADRAKLAAGAGAQLQKSGDPRMYAGQYDVTSPTQQEVYLASIQGSAKKTGADSHNMSTEKSQATREKEKGQKQLQAETKVQQKAQAASGGADSGWRDRIRNAKASDADLEIAFREYQNGRYTPGPKTLEYFRQMGWLGKAVPDEKTADTPKQPQKPVSQAVRDDGHTYESDYDAARNAFTGQKGWLYDMRDDMQYEFKKMGYDDGQAASLANSISNEMFDLGKTGEVTKQDLRALAAKYGLKNVSQLNIAAKEINKSHATLGKNWKRNIDGSWSPV